MKVAARPITASEAGFPEGTPGMDSSRTFLTRRRALNQLEDGMLERLKTLPPWPEEPSGKTRKEKTRVGVCVRIDGTVEEVRTLDSSGDVNFDSALTEAVRSWRYRPLYIDAAVTPFCHVSDFWRPKDPGRPAAPQDLR